jgi:capsular polysaccharide biosynthesis protein
VDDAEETITLRRLSDKDLAAGSWAEDQFGDAEPVGGPAADAASGLASLSYIISAIRRRTRFLCLAGVLGLLLGVGLYVVHPPKVTATTDMLLDPGPNEDSTTAIQTNAALATSRPVAEAALKKLGLNESTSAFLASYTAAPVGLTNNVLEITIRASSGDEAVRQANAVAQAFMAFRATQLRAYQNLTVSSLEQQVMAGKSRISSLQSQVDQLKAITSPTAEEAQRLVNVSGQLSNARQTQSELVQSARSTQQSVTVATNTAVRGSIVLNSGSAAAHSKVKKMIIFAVSGLIGLLAIGIGIVVVSALVSDRLRRRDDVAQALGVPVRLSIGRVRPRKARALAAASRPEIQRVTGHLASLLPDMADGQDDTATVHRAVALAVIPSDRTEIPALSLVALALARAGQGQQVILADLVPGAPAGRLLGIKTPGLHQVSADGLRLTLFVAEAGTIPPFGPLRLAGRPGNGQNGAGQAAAEPAQGGPAGTVGHGKQEASEELAAAWSSAGLLLSLVHLDPMLGSGHLTSWAPGAAVMVTTGESTWTRVQALGEMIRLGGARLVSAILLGADKGDESLGLTYGPTAPHGAPYAPAASLYANGLVGSVNGRPAKAPQPSSASQSVAAPPKPAPGPSGESAAPAQPGAANGDWVKAGQLHMPGSGPGHQTQPGQAPASTGYSTQGSPPTSR